MRRFTVIFAAILSFAPTVQADALTLADLEPAKGDRSVYRISEETTMAFEGTPIKMTARGSGTQTSEVAALSKGASTMVYVVLSSQEMKRTRSPSGSEDTTTSYSMEVCRASANGIYIDANVGMENGEESGVDVGKGVLQIRLPCEPGTSWRVGRLSYKDGFTLRPASEAAAYETVEVPAGTFEKCLKVNSTCPSGIEGYLDQEGQRLEILSGELQATSWYGPRVGLVKEILHTSLRLRPEGQEDAAILRVDTTTTTELSHYRLGQRKS